MNRKSLLWMNNTLASISRSMFIFQVLEGIYKYAVLALRNKDGSISSIRHQKTTMLSTFRLGKGTEGKKIPFAFLTTSNVTHEHYAC